jgi:hypothetical protein
MAKGGKRPGAGRPKGRKDKATIEQKGTLEELARAHTATALGALVSIAEGGESESARVAAANALLDRAYGKPRQAEAGSTPPADVPEPANDSTNPALTGVIVAFKTRKAK